MSNSIERRRQRYRTALNRRDIEARRAAQQDRTRLDRPPHDERGPDAGEGETDGGDEE